MVFLERSEKYTLVAVLEFPANVTKTEVVSRWLLKVTSNFSHRAVEKVVLVYVLLRDFRGFPPRQLLYRRCFICIRLLFIVWRFLLDAAVVQRQA